MEPYPATFTEGPFVYTQCQRQGMIALYTQTHRASRAVRYEVVVLRESPSPSMAGWP